MQQLTIMPGRLNGQYIIEGLAAGTFVCMGGIGFLMLRQGVHTRTKTGSLVLVGAGALMLGVVYNLLIAFVRMKVGLARALRFQGGLGSCRRCMRGLNCLCLHADTQLPPNVSFGTWSRVLQPAVQA